MVSCPLRGNAEYGGPLAIQFERPLTSILAFHLPVGLTFILSLSASIEAGLPLKGLCFMSNQSARRVTRDGR